MLLCGVLEVGCSCGRGGLSDANRAGGATGTLVAGGTTGGILVGGISASGVGGMAGGAVGGTIGGGALPDAGAGGVGAADGAGAGGVGASAGGVGGTGGSLQPSTGVVTADGLLDSGGAEAIVVATDERHVAYLRDYLPIPKCPTGQTEESNARAQQIGTLRVATLAADGSFVSRVVGEAVRAADVHFSPDSRTLVYVDGYDPCVDRGALKVAGADGTNPRVIDALVSTIEIVVTGDALFYRQVAGQVLGVWLPDGTPVVIPGSTSIFSNTYPSPDGRRVAQFDGNGNLAITDISTGATLPVDLAAPANTYDRAIWSPDSKHLAITFVFTTPDWGGLALLDDNGTTVTTLVANHGVQSVQFSPDSTRLAYDAPNSTGGSDLIVHPLIGAADLRITGFPDPASNYSSTAFSPDGSLVVVTTGAADSTSAGEAVYVASATAPDVLRPVVLRTDSSLLGGTLVPGGDAYLAAWWSSGTTEVVSLQGPASNVLSGFALAYEPQAANPRILLGPTSGATVGGALIAFTVAATGGANPTTITFPAGAIPTGMQPQWLGHAVVYGYAPTAGVVPNLYALPGGASTGQLLAAGAAAYGWAPVDSPTRIFYGHTGASGGGSAGLWVAAAP